MAEGMVTMDNSLKAIGNTGIDFQRNGSDVRDFKDR